MPTIGSKSVVRWLNVQLWSQWLTEGCSERCGQKTALHSPSWYGSAWTFFLADCERQQGAGVWCPVSKRLWERTAACASRPNYVTGKDLSVDSRSCPLLLDCAIAINRRKAPLTCRLNLVCLFCTCTCQSFDGSTSGLTVPLPIPSVNR